MAECVIARVTSPDEIDAVLMVEASAFTNPWTREMYVNEMQNEGVSFIYAARDGAGRMVGFCSFWKIFDELHINNLAIVPEWRRRGVASALLVRILDEGTALGLTSATLEVRRSNEPARQLYERFGFTEAGVRPGYYTNPVEDALVLWRNRS